MSVLLPSTKLKKYLCDKYPPGYEKDKWRSADSLRVLDPYKVVDNKPSDKYSYYYPDGTPGDWFVFGKQVFVSGSRFIQEIHERRCSIYEYRFDDLLNKVFLMATFSRSIFTESEGEKELVKRIMRKISGMNSLERMLDFLDKFEENQLS